MALPKVKQQTFEIFLIGSGKNIKYRPFTVREFKILLAAKESDDPKQQVSAVEQILNNCIVDEMDPMELTMFDAERLFLDITAKSRGEEHVIKYRYTYEVDGVEKQEVLDVTINLNDVQTIRSETEVSDIVYVGEGVGIKLKYPTLNSVKTFDGDSEVDRILSCIEYVFDDAGVYPVEDQTKSDLTDFVDDLTAQSMAEIQKFLNAAPRIYHSVTIDLPDGKKEKLEFKNINDFFV